MASGVRHHDHDRFRSMLGDLLGDALDDLHICLDEIVPTHAGLAWQACGHDDDIGVGNVLVVAGSGDSGIEMFDWSTAGEIKRHALATPSLSGISTRTTSPNSLAAAQWAHVAPTFPAPMTLIFARRIVIPLASIRLSWFAAHRCGQSMIILGSKIRVVLQAGMPASGASKRENGGSTRDPPSNAAQERTRTSDLTLIRGAALAS